MAPATTPASRESKKQQTLSSFFTPKPTPAAAHSNGRKVVLNGGGRKFIDEDFSNGIDEPSSRCDNRVLQEESVELGIVDEEDFPIPSRKRVKLSVETETSPTTLRQEVSGNSPLQPISANATLPRTESTSTKPAKVTDRTSKYLFSSSPLQNGERTENTTTEGEDPARKAELHRRFVKKLGRPDSIAEIKRRNRAFLDDNTLGAAAELDEAEEDVEDEPAPPPPKAAGRGKKASTKLTPMERQVIDIKHAHPDTVLVVEVGYKFRFFGADAQVAAKELSIVCIPGKMRFDDPPHPLEGHLDRFASASIPVHRLHVHVKRLVNAGHKVGVVRQLETAALKKVGDNRNAPFTRKLTNLYTKGTYVDDLEGLENNREATPESTGVGDTGFLLCITEINVKGYGNDEKVHIGMVAVQPSTGDIIYDDFEDGFMRGEIETRLLHISPCEFLLTGEISKATDKIVAHLANKGVKGVRIERVPRQKTAEALAHAHVSQFYADKLTEISSTDSKAAKVMEKILGLPENVMVCLSAMIKHLSDYGLEHVFDLTKYFQPFSARSHMLLNGNTLTSLEVYLNQTDYTVKGSLLWCLDRTVTRFGSRMLRKWIGRPLLQKDQIEERLEAVEELLNPAKDEQVDRLRRILSKLRIDLEKSLIRIYYGKCTRPELLNVLQSLQILATEFAFATTQQKTGFESPLLANAVMTLPEILPLVIQFLDRINLRAAKEDDKYAFFREEFETETIEEHKMGIASVEDDLDNFRTVAAEKIGKKHPVQYVTVAGIEYLIEVENSSASMKKIPASWAKISGTKKLSRFHPPEVVKLVQERDQHKESLAAACDEAFRQLLLEISAKYQTLRDAIQGLAYLDCLLSLTTVAQQPGYVRPSFTDDKIASVDVQGARHPMIEQLLVDNYVPNDIHLDNGPQNGTRALLVTGPNMGGKSSYVRSVALIAIMAQVGSFVPAQRARIGILDAVFTRMGAFDNMLAGESTFMVELGETSEILRACTEKSLVVLDELGRGTSTHDGVAIAGSVLDWLVRNPQGPLTLFITHYQVLARMAERFQPQHALRGSHFPDSVGEGNRLRNVHMRFHESRDGDTVTFLYEVGDGVAQRSYGLNVARLANVSAGVIERAKEKSAELECRMKGRLLAGVARWVGLGTDTDGDIDVDGSGDGGVELDTLVERIEEL